MSVEFSDFVEGVPPASTGVNGKIPVVQTGNSRSVNLTDLAGQSALAAETDARTSGDNLRVLKAGDTMTGALVNNYTGPSPTIMIEGNFNQTLTSDTSWGPMGEPAIIASVGANKNCIIGYTYQNAPPWVAGQDSYPCGVTGYGKLPATSQGNLVFGMYALAELYPAAGGMSVGHEITSRNYAGTPDVAIPPDIRFGTSTRIPNGLQLTAGGDYDSSIGLLISPEGGSVRNFNTAIYMAAFRQNGLYLGAQPSGNQNNIVSKNNGTGINVTLQTTAAIQPNNAVFAIQDMAGASKFDIRQSGDFYTTGSAAIGSGSNAGYKLNVSGLTSTSLRIAQQNVGGLTRAQLDALFNLNNSGTSAFGWNFSGGGGEADWFINQGGGGIGGFTVYAFPNTTGNPTALITVQGGGVCQNASGSWTTFSDGSLKESVEPYTRGLEAIVALSPVQFRYSAGMMFAPDEPSAVHFGLIAEDVKLHIPEIVGETKTLVRGEERTVGTLDNGNLIFALINSIKELKAEIEDLKAQVKPVG